MSTMRPLTRTRGRPRIRSTDALKDTTLRNFDGGWNVIDSDLNLAPKFAKVTKNMYRGSDGSVKIRWGTRKFADISNSVTSGSTKIVGMTYYQERIVAATAGGQIFTIDGTGTVTRVWDSTIAAALSLVLYTTLTNKITTTAATARIDIEATSHGLSNGASVTVAGATSIDNIPSTEINGTHTITVVDTDNFYFSTTTPASAGIADTGGEITVSWADPVTTPGWGTTEQANFEEFNGELIIVNGSDKPLIMADDYTVQYLYDIGSDSNQNTPIAKYVRKAARFLVMAGDPTDEDAVHISNQDTSGTWVGDPAPNNAVTISMGSVAPAGGDVVRGLNYFRDRLVIGHSESLVLATLGIFSGASHSPSYDDTVELFGCVSHNSMQTLGDDMLYMDLIGIPGIKRALFTSTIQPDRTSQLIDPEVTAAIDKLSLTVLDNQCFSVYNQRDGQYMLFVPNVDNTPTSLGTDPVATVGIGSAVITVTETAHGRAIGDNVELAGATAVGGITAAAINTRHVITAVPTTDTYQVTVATGTASSVATGGGSSVTAAKVVTETICYVYTSIPKLKVFAWSEFRGWCFTAACRSVGKRVFFANENGVIYVYGTTQDPIYVDYLNDSEYQETGYDAGEGMSIDIDYELPWADFGSRGNIKVSRYISLDTTGTALFTVNMYVDNLRTDVDGNDAPELLMQFVGGDSGGFGSGDQPYGAGRRASDERLFAWTSKFKIAKLRITGTARAPLAIVGITIHYQDGSIRR